MAGQLELFAGTAENPQGATDGAAADRSAAEPVEAPKLANKEGTAPPTVMSMEEVADERNLRKAFKKVASNKGAAGPDRQGVEAVREHLDKLLPALRKCLLSGDYQPGEIRRVWIPKPGGGQRGLGIPNVVDRIVQQAVHQVLSPNYEPTFHGSSHGFRPGRSCHTAIAEAREHMAQGYEYVVDLDLEKFFDTVHHQRLLDRIGRKVHDKRILKLIHAMLKAKVVMPDGVVVSNDEGTPQGGPLSPLLSNIVLDELDWELAQRGHRFVRYADDCNIYVRTERAGLRVKESVTRFIEKRLRLKVNEQKSAVAKPEERHFLGFRLRREPLTGEVEVLLSQRSQDRIDAKIRALTPRNWGRPFDDCIQRANVYLRGWIGFFWPCSPAVQSPVLRNLDAHLRRRLRAIQLKQWKRRRTIARKLIRHGAPSASAWKQVYQGHRSLWALSHAHVVDRTLNVAWFQRRGLVSLRDEWQRRNPEPVTAAVQQTLLAPTSSGQKPLPDNGKPPRGRPKSRM
jgi:group II intron reverse transcriptase/maturase